MTEFRKKLEKVKDEIIKEACGVTCGTCKHSTFDFGEVGFCGIHEHVLRWGPITVSMSAPRCKQHVPKQESSKRRYKGKEISNSCKEIPSTVPLTLS